MTTRNDQHPTERIERVERVEHVEQVHDRPVAATTRAAPNVNVGGVARPAPVWTVTRVVTLLITVLEVLLLLRFVFKIAGANADQALVAALYGVTEPLCRPFQGIFPEPPVLDVAALLAIVFLFLVGALIVALVRAITTPRSV